MGDNGGFLYDTWGVCDPWSISFHNRVGGKANMSYPRHEHAGHNHTNMRLRFWTECVPRYNELGHSLPMLPALHLFL